MIALAQDRPGTPASGARSGAVLLIASGVSIVLNYVFLLAAGRVLGSEQFGSLAALLGVLAVVLIPASAIQMAVSREVSRNIASGDTGHAHAFTRRALRVSAVWTLPLVGIAFALALPLSRILNIDSLGIVLLAETTFLTALIAPVAMGAIQGSQRFHALASLYLVPFALRLVIFAIAAAAGYRLGGAVFATVLSAIAGTGMALFLIRAFLQPTSTAAPNLRPFIRYLGPVAIGLIGIALLTHVDLLIVKARFPDQAGAYAAASAFARVGFFLPATILAVLFPRTAARQARGEETEDILGRSLIATAVFCGGLALFYAAAGVGLVVATFGPDFAEGGAVLAPFSVAIGLFSIANILVGYHLSRGETRYAGSSRPACSFRWPSSFSSLRRCEASCGRTLRSGAVLIAAHELLVGSSRPALRAGLRYAKGGVATLRAALPEAGFVLLGTIAFVCALFWPLVSHIGSTVLGTPGSDSTGGVAFFWELQREGGYHILGLTHHTMTAAPFGWDGTNAINVQLLLPYYPTYLASLLVGEIVALNLTTLAGYVLSGATMYLLVRYLGCTRLVCAWAALVYIVFPWHLARLEHASLLHIEVLALLILALLAAAREPNVATGRARRRGEPRLLADIRLFRRHGGDHERCFRARRGPHLGSTSRRPPGTRRGCRGDRARRGSRHRRGRVGNEHRCRSWPRRRRPFRLRAPATRARRSAGSKLVLRQPPRFFLAGAHPWVELHRGHELPRPAHVRTGVGLARRRGPPPQDSFGEAARRHQRPCGDVRRRAPLRSPEPGRAFRSRRVDAVAAPLGGPPCVSRRLALGPAVDDGSLAACRARAPGGVKSAREDTVRR